MRALMLFFLLICFAPVGFAHDVWPYEKAFRDEGWIIHGGHNFTTILESKIGECLHELGGDFIVDFEESYISGFCNDENLILWIVILDRLSTSQSEMWGDISFTRTGPDTREYMEVRWYDPQTKKKHIVCNPEHVFCITTKVPLADNTIF